MAIGSAYIVRFNESSNKHQVKNEGLRFIASAISNQPLPSFVSPQTSFHPLAINKRLVETLSYLTILIFCLPAWSSPWLPALFLRRSCLI